MVNTKIKKELHDKFDILEVEQIKPNCFKTCASIMDYIRKATLYRGRMLFVENQSDNLMKENILIALNHLFKTNTYETYNLIKSQNLFFHIEISKLAQISQWDMNG